MAECKVLTSIVLNLCKIGFCRKMVTVHSVRSNLVKMHSKSPSVMAFCPVCLGILPYLWQNTSRDITYKQLRKMSLLPSRVSCSEASYILSLIARFINRANAQIITYIFIYLNSDSVSDTMSFQCFSNR